MPFFWSRGNVDKDSSPDNDRDASSPASSGPDRPVGASSFVDGDAGDRDGDGPPVRSLSPPSVAPATAGGRAEEENATVSEPWTRVFPEAYGIRRSIEDSSFRWCVRESMLWGVATGTVMGLHRLRMKSHPRFAVNVAFGTALLVAGPSYFFCFRRREHQEHVIEMMMAANDFRPGEEMPETVPVGKDHPFLDVKNKVPGGESDERGLQKEFVGRLKEKKEWQEPHQTQDVDDVLKEPKRR